MPTFCKTAVPFAALLLACVIAQPALAQQTDPQADPSQMPSSDTTPAPAAAPQPSEVQQQQTEQQQAQNPGG